MISTPPTLADTSAEEAVLASLLIDQEAIGAVRNTLGDGDFYREKHGIIYRAALALHERGEPVDLVTICDELASQDWLDDVGGAAFITGLISVAPTAAYVEHYAAIVKRFATLRRTVGAASKIVSLAYQPGATPERVFEAALALVEGVAPTDTGQEVLTWKDSLNEWLDLQEKRSKSKANNLPEFPWTNLRGRVPWLRPGMLVVVAANSGVGKTTFLECCAEYWAQTGLQVAFFHFELSRQVMLDRRTTRQSGVPYTELERGELSDEVMRATIRMSEWTGGISYVHCPGWTMDRVASTARKLNVRGQADIVLVDYLQKARLSDASGLTPAQVRGQQVEALKVLSEQAEIPIVLASQLNRESFRQSRKTRHTIRDTGEADEKANVVLILDRPILDSDMYDTRLVPPILIAEEGSMSPIVTVRVDKNTLGETGETRLVLNGPRFTLSDYTLKKGEGHG